MKLKSLCTTKKWSLIMKRLPTEWEKIFASHASNKGLKTRIYRDLKNLNFPKTNYPIKKWANKLNRNFSKEKVKMAKKHKKHMKKCLTSLALKETQL
jgi:hypothetical protein